MRALQVVLPAVVVLVTASASPSLPPAPESASPADRSVLFNVLHDLGFSDTCVASALDACTVIPQESQLATLLKEARDLLQNERDLVQEEKTLLQEEKAFLQEEKAFLQEEQTLLQEAMDLLQKETALLQDGIKNVNKTLNPLHHCKDLLDAGDAESGIRVVHPYPGQPDRRLRVYCDQTTDGGGWTVFQRRTNSSVREDFYRTWSEYRLGFGNMEEEFWLGLDALHVLTSTWLQELRIDLADWEGGERYAKYGFFHVDDPGTKYRLSVGRYSGTAGDGFARIHAGQKFSTHDSDNDIHSSENCAVKYRGAGWYKACYDSNLNGQPHMGQHTGHTGINWNPWQGDKYSLRHTAMMVRPAY